MAFFGYFFPFAPSTFRIVFDEQATNAVCAVKKFKESEGEARVNKQSSLQCHCRKLNFADKTCAEDDLVRKTTLREVKILRLLEQQNIVLLHEAFRRKVRDPYDN